MLHSLRFLCCMCTIQWVLVSSQRVQPSPCSNFRIFPSLSKETLCPESVNLDKWFSQNKMPLPSQFIPSFRSGIPTSRRGLGLNVKDTSSRISADEQLHDLGEDFVASRAAVEIQCGHVHNSPSKHCCFHYNLCCTTTSPNNLHLLYQHHLDHRLSSTASPPFPP